MPSCLFFLLHFFAVWSSGCPFHFYPISLQNRPLTCNESFIAKSPHFSVGVVSNAVSTSKVGVGINVYPPSRPRLISANFQNKVGSPSSFDLDNTIPIPFSLYCLRRLLHHLTNSTRLPLPLPLPSCVLSRPNIASTATMPPPRGQQILEEEPTICVKCELSFKTFTEYHQHKIRSRRHITCEACSQDFESHEACKQHHDLVSVFPSAST